MERLVQRRQIAADYGNLCNHSHVYMSDWHRNGPEKENNNSCFQEET